MSKRAHFLALSVVIISLLCAATPQSAQARDKSQVAREFHAAFEKMYAKPGDVNLTLDYAKLAVELGDYESALSPLERVLMINPNLPEARLELGIMYFKLNSKLVAKEHLKLVVDDASADAALKQRAQEYLAKL
jgi:tetratricopeptide (TPR) repeat protein